MPMLSIYIDEQTEARLRVVSEELGRTIEDLAEAAVAEAALEASRSDAGKRQ